MASRISERIVDYSEFNIGPRRKGGRQATIGIIDLRRAEHIVISVADRLVVWVFRGDQQASGQVIAIIGCLR